MHTRAYRMHTWCQEKKGRALESCFGLISPHQQSILHPYLDARALLVNWLGHAMWSATVHVSRLKHGHFSKFGMLVYTSVSHYINLRNLP